jgi:hypothetical protein
MPPTKKTRARNPRVLAVETLKHIQTLTKSSLHFWRDGLYTTEPDPTRPGNHLWRRKVGDELPEHDPAEWDRLAAYATAIRDHAEGLATFARAHARQVRLEQAAGTYEKDVHTEHCCKVHGCKYGDGNLCPVESGAKPQSFACEQCDE